MIARGEYGYQRVNVATEQRDPNSLINWIERLIRTRKQCPEFGAGSWQILETNELCVFAHCCEWQDKTVIALHNLADRPCTVTLKLQGDKHLIDVFGDRQYEPQSDDCGSVPLEAYGYRWLRVN